MPMLAPISLEQITIASPCTAKWEEMKGDDRTRFCAECKLNVYNIAGMTREEAIALLLAGASDRLCVRLYRREDGTVITSDCPVGLAVVRARLQRFASGLAAFLGLSTLAGITASRIEPEFPVRQSGVFTSLHNLIFGAPPPVPVAGSVTLGGARPQFVQSTNTTTRAISGQNSSTSTASNQSQSTVQP